MLKVTCVPCFLCLRVTAAAVKNQRAFRQSLPDQYSVEIARRQVQALVLGASQTEANSQEHQGQGGHPREHEADRPHVKPAKHTHGKKYS